MNGWIELKHFKAWCISILPTIFDESMSYYEVLCKLTQIVNDGITDIEILKEEVERQGTTLNEFIVNVNNKIEELEVTVENAADMAEKASADANTAVENANNAVNAANDATEKAENALTQMNGIKSELQTSIEENTASIAQLNSNVGQTQQNIITLQETIREVSEKTNNNATEIASLKVEVNENSTRITTINESVQSLESTVDENTTAIENASTKITENTQNITNLQKELSDLEAGGEGTGQTVSQLQQNVELLNSKVETAEREINDIKGNITSQIQINQDLTTDILRLNSNVQTLETDNLSNKNNIISLKTDVERLKKNSYFTNGVTFIPVVNEFKNIADRFKVLHPEYNLTVADYYSANTLTDIFNFAETIKAQPTKLVILSIYKSLGLTINNWCEAWGTCINSITDKTVIITDFGSYLILNQTQSDGKFSFRMNNEPTYPYLGSQFQFIRNKMADFGIRFIPSIEYTDQSKILLSENYPNNNDLLDDFAQYMKGLLDMCNNLH